MSIMDLNNLHVDIVSGTFTFLMLLVWHVNITNVGSMLMY
jgi:hypothetical protein